MGSDLKQVLRDIHGLDTISWWPLSTDLWLAILLLSAAVILMAIWIRQLILYPPGSWRREARKALGNLQRRLSKQSSKESAGELSQLLRRIAIVRYGRSGQASLEGDNWLKWLTDTDPNQFNWQHEGEILTRLPYAPEGTETDTQNLRKMVRAAIRLVGSSPPKSVQPGRRQDV